jgi:hypothetical protein
MTKIPGPTTLAAWVDGLAVAVAAAVVLVLGFFAIWGLNRPVLQFASLPGHPDRSLQGTVAYYADQSRCVKIVAAAGGRPRLCSACRRWT